MQEEKLLLIFAGFHKMKLIIFRSNYVWQKTMLWILQ